MNPPDPDSASQTSGGRAPRLWFVTFEHRHEPLLPMRAFLRRVGVGILTGATLILGSLVIGIAGYHWIGHLGWIDSILNASMILTGMGPVDRLATNAAKLFASAYALFSGVMFLTSVGVLLSPVFHRFIHKFHLEFEESEGGA